MFCVWAKGFLAGKGKIRWNMKCSVGDYGDGEGLRVACLLVSRE